MNGQLRQGNLAHIRHRRAKLPVPLPESRRPERYAAALPAARCSLPNTGLICAAATLPDALSNPTRV